MWISSVDEDSAVKEEQRPLSYRDCRDLKLALLLRGSYVIIEKLVVGESGVVLPRRLKKVVRR